MSKSEKCTPRLAVRDSDGKLLLSHVSYSLNSLKGG